jgi:hypothetical protein
LNKQNELIGNWIKTETELELVKTLSHKKIAHFTKEDMASLVEVMAKWKVLLGATNEATSEELILICQFIYDNFKKFTLEDIKIAMNWSISGKIDMSFVSTKTISALYVSKALQLYENEKKNVINKIAEEKLLYERKKSRDEVIIATPEEKANTFKTILIDLYSDYKNNGNFFDFGDFVYNWIKDNILPIVLVVGGIIDQTTDLLVQLLSEINAPAWAGTLLRIIIISIAAFKLYYTDGNKKRTN